MINKNQKREMLDYVVSNIEDGGLDVRPRTKELVSGIDSNYILVGDKELIFLVDQVYPNNVLSRINQNAMVQGKNSTFLLFKDGETFFRSAAREKRYKKDGNLSLKHYTNKDLHRMIMFRPEESYCLSNDFLQYYQPESARLEQGIVSFKFRPVIFDYSHLPYDERPRGKNMEESKKLKVWSEKEFNGGAFKLEDNFLVPQ